MPALGYTVSIACLIWVYRGFNWHEELPRILDTNLLWVSVAVVADITVYAIQGWRWSLILRPIERVSVPRSIQAVYIGLFANEVLPLRSGEVIRCWLQARWHGIPFSLTISSAVIERLLDGAWLMLFFWIVTYFIKLPGYLVAGAQLLALLLGFLGALLVIAVIHKKHAHAAVKGSRWAKILRLIVDGSHDMARSRSFLLAAFLSLIYLLLQVVPIYALARGYGLELPLAQAAVVTVVLRFGSVPPQAPSNMGGFQFFTILGLGLFGIARAEATGFATLLFVVVTVPLWLGGFIALLATRMRLQDIHKRAHDRLDRHRSNPGD